MEQHHRDQLGIKLTQLAMLYGKDFPKEQATLFINSLISFIPDTFENYMKALSSYAEDSKNKFFPAPNSLRPYLIPDLDDEAVAVEASSRTMEAVSRFGWNNSTEAKAYVGELGWRAVSKFGGWSYICENLGNEISLTTFQAQVREITRSQIKMAKAGISEGPIQLPQSQNQKRSSGELTSVSNIVRLLTKDDNDGSN